MLSVVSYSEKAFDVLGTLKSSEHLLLAGPYGNHILQGCFHAEVEHAVFCCLDLIGMMYMWQKEVSMETLCFPYNLCKVRSGMSCCM